MSGFLTNLLERSRGTAEVIRPRVASMFEPPGIEAAGDWVSEPFEQSNGEPQVASPRKPARHTTPPPPLSLRVETHPDTGEVRDTKPAETPLENPAHVTPSPLHRPVPESAPPRTPRRHTVSPEALATFTPAVLPRESRIASPRPSLAEPPPATQPRPQTIPLSHESPAARKPPSTPERALPERRAVAIPTLSPPPARRPRFEPAVTVAKAPPSEPSIHITIGRIEVRADAEPAVRSKPRVESPVMGLNEYLKTRGDKR